MTKANPLITELSLLSKQQCDALKATVGRAMGWEDSMKYDRRRARIEEIWQLIAPKDRSHGLVCV